MKIASLTCNAIGLIGALMAGLTALGVVPGFVDFGLYDMMGGAGMADIAPGIDTFKSVTTTMFWGGLALLMFLAAIAFGAIAEKE